MDQILVKGLYNENVFYLVQKFTEKEKKQYDVNFKISLQSFPLFLI